MGQSKRTQRRQLQKQMKLTIQSIANLSGVSTVTVSSSQSLPLPAAKVVCALEKFQPVLSDKPSTHDSYAFELDFLRVGVKRGLGRNTWNDLLAILNRHKKSKFP